MAKNNLSILVLTPAIDRTHSVLGFIPNWMEALAKRVRLLIIITPLYSPQTNLSNNVKVVGLNPRRRLYRRIYYHWQLIKAVPKVDVIFCHMIPGFVISLWPIAVIYRKPIVLWYAHGEVSLTLKIAHLLANRVVTSSPDGFRIKSNKVNIIGQGIDANLFRPRKRKLNRTKNLLFVGRISPVKRIETLIRAMELIPLRSQLWIVGAPASQSDQIYYRKIIHLIKKTRTASKIKLIGPVSYRDLPKYYQRADVFVSDSQTGSLDKTILEAMACAVPVVISIPAFRQLFNHELKAKCLYRPGDYQVLAMQATRLLKRQQPVLTDQLRQIVVHDHNLDKFIAKLVLSFNFHK